MNTLEINACLKSVDGFIGTFPSDQLPKPRKRPYCFVANTDNSHGMGKHWIAFYFSPNQIEVYDTYGRDLMPQFKHYIGKQKYICNKKILQSVNSTVCGQHCIYFLYHRSRGKSLKQISGQFKDPLENDSFVRCWVKDKFQHCKSIKCKGYGQTCQSFLCQCDECPLPNFGV